MNFCVYLDTASEVHGYFVPDGFSTIPKILVRVDGNETPIEITAWIFVEGARAQGAHQTGNVGFILSDDNVPGISQATRLELSDPVTGLVFYRRAQPGQYLSRKVLRLETSYVPQSELDLSIAPYFQFFANKIEHFGFETVRQMMEIIHQPSVYISGRILLKNFRTYIDYNIDTTLVSLRDPFYELALRLVIFARMSERDFNFVSQRDRTLFAPIIRLLSGLKLQDELAVTRTIKGAPKDTLSLLSSPFTQQLVASTPSDLAKLDDVSQALDALSQFNIFDAGRRTDTYRDRIAEALGLPSAALGLRPQLEPIHQLADVLRKIDRVEHLLEADLVLYHFIQKAEERAFGS